MSTPQTTDVSYAQHRGTLRNVYPPPPKNRVGMLNFLTNAAADPCPFTERLKQPSLSPDRLSVPPWRRMASGLKCSIILVITG